MNTENETGVKVPKGQINYNTVAGSLGLAAFAGLGLRNWLGNGNGSVAAGALARLDKESALNKQDIENFKKEVAREFSDVRHDFKAAIAIEAERRESADERIFDYANCNFVKYIKKINAAEICPVVELAARTAGPAVPDPNAPITSTANA